MRWPRTKNEYSDTADLVILYALAGGPYKARDLSHHTLLSRSTIRTRLRSLRDRGLVSNDGRDGEWRSIVRLAPVDPSTMVIPPAPSPVHEPQKANQYESQDYTPAVVPGANMAAATHFHVPATLGGLGPLKIGPAKACIQCGGGTPLVYGDQPVCAKCSRVWRG